MHPDGVDALASAFWVHIIECLARGDMETRVWLDTDDGCTGFLWWCDVSGKDPQTWRRQLLDVWVARPKMPR